MAKQKSKSLSNSDKEILGQINQRRTENEALMKILKRFQDNSEDNKKDK